MFRIGTNGGFPAPGGIAPRCLGKTLLFVFLLSSPFSDLGVKRRALRRGQSGRAVRIVPRLPRPAVLPILESARRVPVEMENVRAVLFAVTRALSLTAVKLAVGDQVRGRDEAAPTHGVSEVGDYVGGVHRAPPLLQEAGRIR